MAIIVKLDHLLLDRRLTLTELADRVGMTIANLSILKTNKARAIRFSTLDALCQELRCQPIRPCLAINARWRSRCVVAVSLGRAVARGGMMTAASGWRSATAS